MSKKKSSKHSQITQNTLNYSQITHKFDEKSTFQVEFFYKTISKSHKCRINTCDGFTGEIMHDNSSKQLSIWCYR